MATPVTVQVAILVSTVSTGERLGTWMMERPYRDKQGRGSLMDALYLISFPGWTSSALGDGGEAQPVVPATVMFTRALTPTATRQMASATARLA